MSGEEAEVAMDEEALRFYKELDFVQCLANPRYLQCYFSDTAFFNYLAYLKYWQKPGYSKYIIFPNCLWILDLLQEKSFRDQCSSPAFREMFVNELREYQKKYREMKSILPEHQALKLDFDKLEGSIRGSSI